MTNTGQQQMPGMKGHDVHDAVDVLGVLQPVCFRFDVLLFHLYVDHNRMQTLIFRYTINEDKLLAKLEANKRKPMKKSGFMKRLEELNEHSRETLRKQQEAKKNDRIIVIVVLKKVPLSAYW